MFQNEEEYLKQRGVTMDDLAYFIGMLVSPDHYKSIAAPHLAELFSLLTGTLYKYSH